jgi:hypothetical protein
MQHNMCWTPLYMQTNTNNVNKTWALLQTTGGKDEQNIVFFLVKITFLIKIWPLENMAFTEYSLYKIWPLQNIKEFSKEMYHCWHFVKVIFCKGHIL